jgi:hypothetical protein
MRSLKRAGLLIGSVFLLLQLSGCEQSVGSILHFFEQGTNVGLQRCLHKNMNQGLSEETVKRVCIAKHEKTILPKIEGKAEYHAIDDETMTFEAWLRNESNNFVVTGVTLSITHEDNVGKDGKRIAEVVQLRNLWIEPGSTLVNLVSDLKFHPKKDRLKAGEKFLYTWEITRTKGLSIQLQ